MNDIELETLKNYARIIKAFCKKQGCYCGNCPFVKDLSDNRPCPDRFIFSVDDYDTMEIKLSEKWAGADGKFWNYIWKNTAARNLPKEKSA